MDLPDLHSIDVNNIYASYPIPDEWPKLLEVEPSSGRIGWLKAIIKNWELIWVLHFHVCILPI
jgi:hypothetical protein